MQKMLATRFTKCLWTAGFTIITYVACQQGLWEALHVTRYFTPTGQQRAKLDALLLQQRNHSNEIQNFITLHDGKLEDPWHVEQRIRAAAVRRECIGWEKNPQDLPSKLENLHHLLVDDHHRAIYCYIPKVACTNWKRLWMVLTGLTIIKDPVLIPHDLPHEIHHRMMLIKQPISISTLQKKLLTYSKIIVVRNPYERLISAFRDKFEGKGSTHYKKNYAYHIMKNYRKNINTSEIPVSGDGLTFSEFVTYIINLSRSNYDEHWKSYADSCYPCGIHYDVIAKYETMAEDSKRFLNLIKAPSNLHFPKYAPTNTSKLISSYMAKLSTHQRKALYSVYEKDFKMFQYNEIRT
ncbi:carbohydrate sulfotransferase 11-like [Macrobrachium nipponense]|uniref:carbohydrate sulfotransferase 11-like n=1 Tax=Macrobrachium nipponense TaxID=159736 RepID=UPI0030C818E2